MESNDARDIVKRLREVFHDDRSVELMNREAADEIERLRNDLARRTAERDEAINEVSLLRSTVTDRNIEIERLRSERDEARRMYCNAMTDHCEEHEARQIAQEQGWDCLKGDKDAR